MLKLEIVIGESDYLDTSKHGYYWIDSNKEYAARTELCFGGTAIIDMLFTSTYAHVCEILMSDAKLSVIWFNKYFSIDQLARIRNRFAGQSSPIQLSYRASKDSITALKFDSYLAEINSDIRVEFV